MERNSSPNSCIFKTHLERQKCVTKRKSNEIPRELFFPRVVPPVTVQSPQTRSLLLGPTKVTQSPIWKKPMKDDIRTKPCLPLKCHRTLLLAFANAHTPGSLAAPKPQSSSELFSSFGSPTRPSAASAAPTSASPNSPDAHSRSSISAPVSAASPFVPSRAGSGPLHPPLPGGAA